MPDISLTTGSWQAHNVQGAEVNQIKCSVPGVYIIGAVEPTGKEYLVAGSLTTAFTIEYIGYTNGNVTDNGSKTSKQITFDGRTFQYLIIGPWHSPRPEMQIATCVCEDSVESATQNGLRLILDAIESGFTPRPTIRTDSQQPKKNIKIEFDTQGSPLPLRMILATRSGKIIREMPISHIKFKDNLGDGSEVSFDVFKEQCLKKDGEIDEEFWKKISDLRLAYCPEFDMWYEMQVEFTDSSETVKAVTASSLGEQELSQVRIYGLEINTEADIARDDYEPTVLYDGNKKECSLIDRLLYKSPHYSIGHVDDTIKNIQRTFQFNDKSVYEAMQDVAREIGCLFRFECRKTDAHNIERTINVYDLWNTCLECGERGEFMEICDKCGSTNIKRGYGEDTTVYVDKDNLAKEIVFTTDIGSIKNCFRLTAGDDLMTAAIVSCNPNGSQYIWHIPEYMQEDMSDDLKNKLNAYNQLYDYYQNDHIIIVSKIIPEE